MKFALQALFQTFFLEVSRAEFSVRTRRTFCGRLYTKNGVLPKEMVLMCELARETQQHTAVQRTAQRAPAPDERRVMHDRYHTNKLRQRQA